MALQQYFYDKQLRRFLLQFTRMMSNFQCEIGRDDDGNPTYMRIPIRYGNVSKQAATILQNNSANSIPCAPLFTFHISDLSYDRKNLQEPYFVDKRHMRQRQWNEATQDYTQAEGNAFTVERHMPAPYIMALQMDLWTTNDDMKFQIFEQVAPLFNPAMEIQSTDSYLDWTSLSTVELKNYKLDSQSIPNGDGEINISTWNFDLPIWITMPARVMKQGVIHKIVANIFDETGDINEAISGDDILLGTRVQITPHGYQVLLVDNQLHILEKNSPMIQINDTLDPIPDVTSEVKWEPVIEEYGVLRNGISLIYLQLSDGTEVGGTVTYHPTDENILLFAIDPDSLPANTVGPIDAVINPLKSGPNAGLPAPVLNRRYLFTEGTGEESDNSFPNARPLAWEGAAGVELIANENDIVEYNGNFWEVVFDASEVEGIEYVTNITTNLQYKWEDFNWTKSFEGVYDGGDWRLTI
ncbi:MAG: hypothetical protein DRI98_14160 [Bacteroidetes bacterium]|nr:MAG: hypothetical protein DRI98_14160 [Bacteroidota bacterium]